MGIPTVEGRCWSTHQQQQGCGRQLLCFCVLATVGGPHAGLRVPHSEVRVLFLWEEAQLQHEHLCLDCLNPQRSLSELLAARASLSDAVNPGVTDEKYFSCLHHIWWWAQQGRLCFLVVATDCSCTAL